MTHEQGSRGLAGLIDEIHVIAFSLFCDEQFIWSSPHTVAEINIKLVCYQVRINLHKFSMFRHIN